MPLVQCPECGHRQTVRAERLGLHVECRECGEDFNAQERRARGADAQTGGITPVHVFAGVGAIVALGLMAGAAVVALLLLRAGPQPEPVPVAQAAPPVVAPPAATRPTAAVAEPRTQPLPMQPVTELAPPTTQSAAKERAEPAPAAAQYGETTGKIEIKPGSTKSDPLAGVGKEPERRPVTKAVSPDDDNPFFKPPGTRGFGADGSVPKSAPRPSKESPAVPGYYARKIQGFTVLISRLAYDMSDEADGRPVGYLEAELAHVAAILPKSTHAALTKVPVWVEWDHTVPGVRGTVLAAYFVGEGEALLLRGYDPRKEKCVCLMSLKAAFEKRTQRDGRQVVLLHEFAHAVHHQVVGRSNPTVKNAFVQARSRGLYLYDLPPEPGLPAKQAPQPGEKEKKLVGMRYAATSEFEYFAELSCAYLDCLDYPPFSRAELKDYDSVGYELMAKVWGTPEQIEARKAAEAKAK